ncbi:MAG: hypothetical protein EBT07_06855 [Actinobacteria bacterium]|nr:hypothetical protein [Actinomycetota bacterium]
MRHILRSLSTALVLTFSVKCWAQVDDNVVSVRQPLSVDVPSAGPFSSGPSQELKDEARKRAVDMAWRRVVGQVFSGARAQQAADNPDRVRAIANTACDFQVFGERFDKDSKKYSFELRGSCYKNQIDAEFGRMFRGATQQASQGGRARGPMVGFVFLARRAASETNERESSASVSTSGSEGSSESQRKSRGSSRNSSEEDVSVTQRERISTTNSDAVYRYEVESTDDAMTVVASSLQTNGFRVARYPDLVTQCQGPSMGELSRRYAEMKVNTAWNPKDTKGMYDAARQCKVPYFAFGLVEVLRARQVSATGFEVVASLNVKVSDLTEMLPSECASMTKQYPGQGKDRLEAARDALRRVGEQGSRDLMDIIRSNCL